MSVILSAAKDLVLSKRRMTATVFSDLSVDPPVRGWLHTPDKANDNALIVTHGAGSNSQSPLLIAIAETFTEDGYTVLRCDLPYRQERRTGPPFPGQAKCDRDGLCNAVAAMRKQTSGKIYLGGHSYGGRQSTMLCAEQPDLVSGLLLLSYPLHPPRKPEQLRTQHFPDLRTPSLFVHGTRDPFGSIEEMKTALQLIPVRTELIEVGGAGHDLGFKGKTKASELPVKIFANFENGFR
jgi:uncharacterized protein